jgi:hypothetical protein
MRQTLQSLFGLELSTAQKVIIASVVILVLLALLGLFVRQIQGGRLRLRGQAGGRQRQPRLGVVDTYDLDRQRQLVLIRRDNIEHLVMIGGASDVVVETNILRSGGRAVAPSYAETAIPDRPLPPFETLVPPNDQLARGADESRRASPPVDVPDMLPPLPHRTAPAHAEIAAAAVAGAGAAAVLGVGASEPPAKPAASPPPVIPPLTTGPAPSFAREHAPPPAVSAGELDDMTRQLEEALKRPFSAVRPSNLPGEAPPLEAPALSVKPLAGTAKPAAEPPKPSAEAPVPLPAPEPKIEPKFEARPEPALTPAPSRSAALPSDVEAELAAALGLTPERTHTKAPEPKPAEPKSAEPKPVEPKPAELKPAELKPAEPKAPEARTADVKAPEPRVAEAKAPEAQPANPEPLPVSLPEPPAEAKPAPAEAPVIDMAELEAAFAEVGKPDEPVAKAEAQKADKPVEPEPKEIDPFSVDAIEAEFARLLGRDPKAKS